MTDHFKRKLILTIVMLATGLLHVSIAAAQEVFTDLPGVKAEKKQPDSQWTSDCSSEIRSESWDEEWDGTFPDRRLGRRVYTCESGPVTFQSTKPPMEYDWEMYKKRN